MPRSRCALRAALLPAINLLAVALLVFSAASASAFAISMNVRGGLRTFYAVSDLVTIDVFLDAPVNDPSGITFLTVQVIADTPGLTYDEVASADLQIIHPAPPAPIYATTGAQPGYILYSPSVVGQPSAQLNPEQSPAWRLIPVAPPGKTVVNINYAEGALGTTFLTGNNIWIGSLVYVISGSGTIELDLDPTFGGTLSAFNGTSTNDLPVTLAGGPFDIVVPEPTTALLLMAGLLLAAHRSRA